MWGRGKTERHREDKTRSTGNPHTAASGPSRYREREPKKQVAKVRACYCSPFSAAGP